jgi:hypothetical protein
VVRAAGLKPNRHQVAVPRMNAFVHVNLVQEVAEFGINVSIAQVMRQVKFLIFDAGIPNMEFLVSRCGVTGEDLGRCWRLTRGGSDGVDVRGMRIGRPGARL